MLGGLRPPRVDLEAPKRSSRNLPGAFAERNTKTSYPQAPFHPRRSGLQERKRVATQEEPEGQQIHPCETHFTPRKPTSRLNPEGFHMPGTSTTPQLHSEPDPGGPIHVG